MIIIGDWYPDPNSPGGWRHDENAPSPGRNPAVTMILPALYPGIVEMSPEYPSGFEHPDGSVYGRPDPDEFEAA